MPFYQMDIYFGIFILIIIFHSQSLAGLLWVREEYHVW